MSRVRVQENRQPDPSAPGSVIAGKRYDRMRAIAPVLLAALIADVEPGQVGAAPQRTAKSRADSAVPHLNADGTIRQPSRVAAAQWRDPDDTQAMERDERGRAHQATVKGYRVADPLDRLPCEADHHKAARRLRQDWERGSGARSGGPSEKVDGGTRDHDSGAAQLQARRDYEDAVAAVGIRACAYVLPVVLAGWTVADLVGRLGGNAMATQGRVMAGLDRLAEWYFPPDQKVVPFVPELPDRHGVTDLPKERLGRVK